MISVTLNQAAIATLIETREGPVGRLVERRAGAVFVQARQNAERIMHAFPQVAQDVQIRIGEDGTATIGIIDAGSAARYLANKQLGRVKARSEELWPGRGWLGAAFDTEFHT